MSTGRSYTPTDYGVGPMSLMLRDSNGWGLVVSFFSGKLKGEQPDIFNKNVLDFLPSAIDEEYFG